jgi:hypothetical protein
MKCFYIFSWAAVLYLQLLFTGCCSNYCAGRGTGDYVEVVVRDSSSGANLFDSLGVTVSDITLDGELGQYQVWTKDSSFQIETPAALSRDNLNDQLMVSVRNREETIAIQYTGSGDEPCCQVVSPIVAFIEPLGNAQVRNEGGEWRLTIFW